MSSFELTKDKINLLAKLLSHSCTNLLPSIYDDINTLVATLWKTSLVLINISLTVASSKALKLRIKALQKARIHGSCSPQTKHESSYAREISTFSNVIGSEQSKVLCLKAYVSKAFIKLSPLRKHKIFIETKDPSCALSSLYLSVYHTADYHMLLLIISRRSQHQLREILLSKKLDESRKLKRYFK